MTAMRTLLAFLTLGSVLVVTQASAQPAPVGPPAAAPRLAAEPAPAGPPPMAAPHRVDPSRGPAGINPAPPAAGPSPPSNTNSSLILASPRTGLVCTIFAGNFSLAARGVRLTQYTTMGLTEDCDEQYYNTLTTTSIAAQFRAVQQPTFVVRGGAHYYLMDVNLSTLPKPFIRVGNLRLSPVGHVDLSISELLSNKSLQQGSVVASEYQPFALTSDVHYIWNIGRPIHRLVAPSGDRYIMFGFTRRVIENVDKDNLALIGPLLNPPVGWKYESYLLDRTLTVKASPTNNFTLNVLFDDAYNMYVQTDD